jgi:hypothetical protein
MDRKNSGYKVDFVNKTIIVTRDFHRRASNEISEEGRKFKRLIKDLPDFSVSYANPRRRKPAADRLTYDKMIDYICRQKDAEGVLRDFNDIRNPKDAPPSPYIHVKKWFLTRFPNYNKLPQFDERGRLIQKEVS